MIRYGKSTQQAIAAMSRLAEVYNDGVRLSSHDIAGTRRLPQTLVAKLLTYLSQAGLVTGAPGPRGGYALARPPGEISLYDVASVFERTDADMVCPFGPNWCGRNEPCPLHDKLAEIDMEFQQYLRSTCFDVFTDQTASRAETDTDADA